MKFSKRQIEDAVKDSYSVSEVCKRLNTNNAGSAHSYISRLIEYYQVDRSHFIRGGRPDNRDSYCRKQKTPYQEVLVLRPMESRKELSHRLRRALIESGVEYKCSGCELKDEWNGKSITLQIDHIDGNPLNNVADNLRFLCPNCHSQTDNFGSKKFRKNKTCKECGLNISKGNKTGLCNSCASKTSILKNACRACGIKTNNKSYCSRECAKIGSRRVDRPDRESLESDIKSMPFLAIGRKYGVSDNAIRKWAGQYGII